MSKLYHFIGGLASVFEKKEGEKIVFFIKELAAVGILMEKQIILGKVTKKGFL